MIDEIVERHLSERLERPQRQGNSKKAWREFIVDYLLFLEQQYGMPKKDSWTWYGAVGDGITKMGVKVIVEMAEEGIVEAEIDDKHVGGQPIKGARGRIESWGGSIDFTEVKVKRGKKFPK